MTVAARRSRFALAFLFVGAGVLHFVIPEFYLSFMPPWLPWHRELVYLSGVFEILGGLGVLVPRLRRAACWGLIALLLAVFPANIQMSLNFYQEDGGWSARTLLNTVVRLPLQLVLIAWVWSVARQAGPHASGESP